ncbi:G-type lectin S-receptor-like serine/threonine-protein kinase At2g19130 [Rhodamnia argentea]|uniref:G-type lectin S-receptor-like serine/threonine-protein kinase At2g19130 n=1 Tax=Rhodamnia argentea TaxID=178133 RepID=A0A8B8PV04_9MYRT|nr:G-type lectin S-receptor-like serine/threonine-protein kinase At2g19130 [Rhodamnia argentea]
MFPFMLLLFSVSLYPSFSISTDTIFPGESISGNRTLISQGGTFEMGLFSPGNTGNHYIGIWYKGLPQKTLVWVANRNRPVSDPLSSELKLLHDGNLVLLTSSKRQIWSTGSTSLVPNSTSGVLLNNGNFIFRNISNLSNVAWQSFDHLTDTWLPGAKFKFNTSEKTVLVSWRNLNDPAPGIFSASMGSEGRAVFSLFNRSKAYWHCHDSTGYDFELHPSVKTEDMINFTVDSNENGSYSQYSSVAPFSLSRIVLEPTGLLRQLVWAKHTQEWKVLWTQPAQKCEIYPFCGASSNCNQRDAPLCDCALGYLDYLKMKDRLGRCERRNTSNCSGDRKDHFFLMPNTHLPNNYDSVMVENTEA